MRGLSGGERSRLSLAKMMLFPRNVLALDEPTNHLDIPARETLEEALGTYEGTLLVVSHDRYFLDKVCNRLLVFGQGQGDEDGAQLEAHLGNYSDWRERRETKPPAPKPAAAVETPASPAAVARTVDKDREREQRRLERRVQSLEEEVARLEKQLGELRAQLGGEHGGDWQKLHELADKERTVSELLARRMDEWEKASAALAGGADRDSTAGG